MGKGITAELNKIIDQPGQAHKLAQAVIDIALSTRPDRLPALSIALDRTDGKVPDIKKVQGLMISLTGDDMAKLSQQISDAETLLLEE